MAEVDPRRGEGDTASSAELKTQDVEEEWWVEKRGEAAVLEMDAELDPSDLAQAVADAGGAVAKIAEQLAVVMYAYGVDTIDACAHLI